MSPKLFETERRKPRRGFTKALVPFGREQCPLCRGALESQQVDEPTLFRHGGHGATRRTIRDLCTGAQCHWSMTRSVQEVNPR